MQLPAAWKRKTSIQTFLYGFYKNFTFLLPRLENKKSGLIKTRGRLNKRAGESVIARNSGDTLARHRFEKEGWTLFSRFGRTGKEEQELMSFSKLTRPRFGKRSLSGVKMEMERMWPGRGWVTSEENNQMRPRSGRKNLSLED